MKQLIKYADSSLLLILSGTLIKRCHSIMLSLTDTFPVQFGHVQLCTSKPPASSDGDDYAFVPALRHDAGSRAGQFPVNYYRDGHRYGVRAKDVTAVLKTRRIAVLCLEPLEAIRLQVLINNFDAMGLRQRCASVFISQTSTERLEAEISRQNLTLRETRAATKVSWSALAHVQHFDYVLTGSVPDYSNMVPDLKKIAEAELLRAGRYTVPR